MHLTSAEKMEKQIKKENEKKTALAMAKLKEDLLESGRLQSVVNTVINAALDDEHKHQSAAWKLLMDRVMPQTMFEQEVSKGQARNAIQINISTMGQPNIIEGELTDD